jgi:hypothetical protein
MIERNLRNDLISAEPMDFNFGEGFTETWDLVYPSRDADIDVILSYLDDNQELDEDRWRTRETPMGSPVWQFACECDDPTWRDLEDHCGLCSAEFEDFEDEVRDQFAEVVCERPEDWEPMMNYAYPAPGIDAGEMQAMLIGDPLCVVEINGGTFLALQGGGMDMRWEICAAYVALGHRPPVAFCDLPNMAGRGESASDRRLMEICAESCEMLASWHTRSAERLRERIKVRAA